MKFKIPEIYGVSSFYSYYHKMLPFSVLSEYHKFAAKMTCLVDQVGIYYNPLNFISFSVQLVVCNGMRFATIPYEVQSRLENSIVKFDQIHLFG